MALVGWILSFIALFAGLALRQDMPVGGSADLSSMLFAASILACPMIWSAKPLGITRGRRIVLALILICCVPMVLLPTG